MSRGRPRKPTALKILSGNPGRRPLPVERLVEHGPAVKPKWVENDPRISAVWDDLASDRITMGLLTSVTCEEFGQLCAFLGEFRKDPMSLSGPQLSAMQKKLNAFGFNPSALASLKIATPNPDAAKNPFAVLSS